MEGIDRKTFLMFAVGPMLVGFAGLEIYYLIFPGGAFFDTDLGASVANLWALVSVGIYIAGIFLRLKNLKQSGLWFFLIFVPFVNVAFIVSLFFVPPQEKKVPIFGKPRDQSPEIISTSCPDCGEARKKEDKFCGKCGSQLES